MTREYLIERLKQQPNREYIDRAIKHENVIKFISQFALNKGDLSRQQTHLTDFLNAVRNRLNNDDAFLNFENNITYPLQTNELIESMFNALKRIFDANDKYINFEFDNVETKQDSQKFINVKWFQNEGWELFTHSPNTVLIVDLPEVQVSDLPEPYLYPVPINKVLDIDVEENQIKSIIYEVDEEFIIGIDSESYIVLQKYKKGNDWDKLIEIANIEHTLNRCPANFLNNKNLYSDNEIIKASPISKSIGEILDLLVLYVNKTIIDNYIVPYIVKYGDNDCDYDNGAYYCDGGLLKVKAEQGEDSWAQDGRTHKFFKCPKCNKTTGYAETIKVPTPQDKDEYDLATNALTFITPDTTIFTYSDTRIADKEKKIYNQVVGITQDLNPKQQQNEVRVKTNLENQNQVLINWKKPFESSIMRTNNDVLMFRYKDKFLGSVVDLGRRFFMQTMQEIFEEKTLAKENGLDNIIDYDQQAIDAKYSNNPEQRKRALLMLELSRVLRPLNEKTPEAVDSLYLADKISRITYILYTEFYNFLSRYEAEKGMKITEFDFNNLVKELKETFNKYISDYEQQSNVQSSPIST